MGAPTSAVTELTGSAPSIPGIRAIRLQANAKSAPISTQAGVSMRWSDAPKSMFHAARVGMLTEPRATLSKNSTIISAVMISILGMTERFIEPLRY